MKGRPRRPKGSQPTASPTRRQFLSTVVIGAAYTACGDRGMHGGPGPAPGPDPARPPRDARAPATSPPPPADAQLGPGPLPPDAAAAADAATADAPSAPPTGTRKTAADVVVLGATGIRVSRLAMGSGTHGSGGTSAQTQLGIPGFSRLLVQGFHEQGITFWETADGYGAHPHLKEAIRQVGRDKLVIMTKTKARTASQMQADLDRFRTELGIDMIDIVLLHAVESGTWTRDLAGAMDTLSAAKQRGDIRAHGISCHSLPALRLAAKTPWVDVDLARINPARIEMDADPATVIGVLREMRATGKGVIGMKILGVGALARTMDSAIAHAVNLNGDAMDCFTIGFTSNAQLQQVTAKIAAPAV